MPDQSKQERPTELEADIVNLSEATLDEVEADIVHISQGGANKINAKSVEMRQGGALAIEANELSMTQSGSLINSAGNVSMDASSAAAVLSDEFVAGNSRVGLAVANRAHFENSSPLVLLARDVEGSVEPLLDTRGALLAGIASGFVVGSMLLIGKLIRRR